MAQVEHDKYVEDLCSKIRPKYDKLFRNVRIYSKHKRPRSLAEIDVIAVKGRTLEAYEVKCSYRKIMKIRRKCFTPA